MNSERDQASAPSASIGGPPLPQGALPLTGWRQTFSSLSGNRDFALLFWGNIGFFFGMNMMIILRGWLVFDKWENASYLGYIMATVAVPMLILSPIGGVVADRVDKRKLLLATQVLLVFNNSIVTVLILTDAIQFWHLLAVSTLSGAAFSFNMPARQALVAMLVPRDKLMNAISLSTAAMNASRIVAPPLAGILVYPIGIGGAYIVSTAFYALTVVVTTALPALPPRRERDFTFVEDFVGGFRYIRGSPLLLGLLLFATIPMIFALPYQTLMPVFADEVWDVGSAGFGVLQAGAGAGGLVGALVIANLDAYPRKGRLLVSGALAFGGFLALFALSPWFYIALVLIAVVGFASMIVMTVNNTAIQLVIPDEVRGRVMSVMMMSFGLMPLGAVPAGIAAEAVGAPPVVVIGALLFVASTALILAAIPAFRSLDRELEEGRDRETARRAPLLDEEPAAGTPIPAGEPMTGNPASAQSD
jgi:MFS family permease